LSGPQPSEPQATSEILEPLRAYLRRLDAENGALAQRAHPAGCTVLRAAWTLLDGPVPRRGYQPLGNPAHTLDLTGEGHGIVPMARVAAILWQAIDQLPDQTAEATAIRDERRLAFVAAMAACVDDDGSLVCAPGQAQQLVMVLQGFVPGVQVEHYDAVVAVEEFVKVEELRLRHRLGTAGPFEPEQVRARLDEIYLAGGAVYVGPERDRLRRHLRDLAHMQYDVSDWAPPNVS
jgi:hypothetical protein